jgi:hypothetical protein
MIIIDRLKWTVGEAVYLLSGTGHWNMWSSTFTLHAFFCFMLTQRRPKSRTHSSYISVQKAYILIWKRTHSTYSVLFVIWKRTSVLTQFFCLWSENVICTYSVLLFVIWKRTPCIYSVLFVIWKRTPVHTQFFCLYAHKVHSAIEVSLRWHALRHKTLTNSFPIT